MPKEPNKAARLIVPLVVGALALLVVFAFFKNSGKTTPPAPAANTPAASKPAPASPQPANASEAEAAKPAAAQPEVPAPAPVEGLRAEVFTDDPLAKDLAPLGSLVEGGTDRMELRFSPSGAAVTSLRLADHFDGIKTGSLNTQLQSEHRVETPQAAVVMRPLAALSLEVNGSVVSVFSDAAGPVWRQVAPDKPGEFEAFIIDGTRTRLLRLWRKYSLVPASYTVRIEQRVENLSDKAVRVRLHQLGPVDLPPGGTSYGGDRRRVRFGYLLKPALDPTRQIVVADKYLIDHGAYLGKRDATGMYGDTSLWPNATAQEQAHELVWLGVTDRYYGVALFPLINSGVPAPEKRLLTFSTIDRIVLDGGPGAEVVALRISSAPVDIAPGKSADLSLGMYAGPLSRPEIRKEPLAKSAGIDGLVIYNMGGPCAWCTFQSLARPLLSLLHFFHDTLLHDWALSIMLLVLCVRTVLHPVTRWTQIRMAKFGKRMQMMQPKMKKLQEKYKDDKAKLQGEVAKLWREEGVSPLGFLGCIPAFLQSPVWFAMYAVLFLAVELRHQGAFFGLFQAINANWSFLGDLAEPDRFVYFGKVIATIPLLGPIASFNILPVLLGLVFFAQQKYLTPPSAPGTLTPEQESQQKMMKWMMVIMFPLMMYNAPCGLSLYFITNSVLGILESKWIRAHMDKKGMLTEEALRKKPGAAGGGGFLGRLQAAAQARAEQVAKSRQSRTQGPGRKK